MSCCIKHRNVGVTMILRHRCKESVIKVGDHVRIREFRRQHKLHPDFTNDMFVVEQLVGKNAVKLTDGRVWNLRDCLNENTPVVEGEENTVDDFDEPQLIDLSLGLNDDIPYLLVRHLQLLFVVLDVLRSLEFSLVRREGGNVMYVHVCM